MDNLIVATNAVVPFIVYLFAGFLCAKSGLAKEEFLRTLNGFVFKAFFPFIMFNNLYDVDFSSLRGSVYVLFAVAMTVAVILSAALIVPRVVKEDSRRGVIIQASFRSNTILYAIPLVESVFGEAGAVKASILVAFIVPLYNIVSVVVLEKYRGGRVSASKLITNILKNPLIIGAIAGIIFNALPITMPSCLATPVSAMAGMAVNARISQTDIMGYASALSQAGVGKDTPFLY